MMRAALSFFLLTANFVLLAYCDNLALLSGTLRRYEKAACEDESLALSCPPGTSISVEMAQYGTGQRAASTLCPPPHATLPLGGETICDPPNSLQTVVEACQKKRSCKFLTSTKSFGGDPCPGVQKYVIVAYKCRPYEFRSKVACENDVVQLQCNPNSRIAVYSASYGRTEYESVQCPQPQGVPEETCLVSYATETVMQICHGKRRCTLSADSATFGSPCKKESRMYLKVVYTCVPRKVLRDQYEERPEEDEMLEMDEDSDDYGLEDTENNLLPSPNLAGRHNTSVSSAGGAVTYAPILRPTGRPAVNRTLSLPPTDFVRDSTEHPDVQNDSGLDSVGLESELDPLEDEGGERPSLINCSLTIHTVKRNTVVIGFVSHWITTYSYLSKNKERLTLYLIVSAGAGLICIMALAIGRLAWSRHKAKRAAVDAQSTHLPRPFTDDLSEVEADIDLTLATPVALMHHHSPPPAENWEPIVWELLMRSKQSSSGVEEEAVVRYSGEGTAPRSLSRSGGNAQYYYG